MPICPEAEALLHQRFGGDSLIALATCENNTPAVRTVDAFYHDGCFYVLTHAQSRKMKQLAKNPACAISGDWFTAQGTGENLGWFQKPENAAVAERMRTVFAEWLHNGHSDLNDPNTCILCIHLQTGVLFSHGTRYELVF